MQKKNVLIFFIRSLARRFRALQEVWILPWWGSGGLASAPLWAFDALVLAVKLWSTCTVAIVKYFVPPVMKSLHGETILITGAGHGLGRELAVQCAELGATVICWDNDARRNNAVVDEIRKKDGECYGFTIDVTSRDQVMALALRMRKELVEVSMVVSNAGSLTCAPLIQIRSEAVARLIEINLLAHFWIIQAFLPIMIERRHGHIVAINSSAGLMPCADLTPYCAAKFGLRGLMESITEELRLDTWTKNINTTSVYIATVSTGLYPPPSHRFTAWYSEITAKEAAKIIIEDAPARKTVVVCSGLSSNCEVVEMTLAKVEIAVYINIKDIEAVTHCEQEILKSIRKNHKNISIPLFMKSLIDFNNLMPYRIRIIFTDFFNFGHRGWFCFC